MKTRILSSLLVFLYFSPLLFAQEIIVSDYSVEYKEKADLNRVIGADVKLPIISNWVEGGFFVVSIYSKNSLIEALNKSGASLFLEANFCETDGKIVILGLPEVYFDGASIFNLKSKGKI